MQIKEGLYFILTLPGMVHHFRNNIPKGKLVFELPKPRIFVFMPFESVGERQYRIYTFVSLFESVK